MEEIVAALRQLLEVMQVIVGHAFDLGAALLDLLWTSSVSLPAPVFFAVMVSVLLLGLLLGRISKRGGPEMLEIPRTTGDDRVVLDLERLRPLGLSAEEEAESEVMDVSRLRPDEMTQATEPSDRRRRQGSGSAPAR